jgi:putative spermidine/putrescine transport system substrate-binding protein
MSSSPKGAEGSTRRQVATGLAAGLATLSAPRLLRAQQRVLYINSQGGSWEASARKNLFDPFTQRTGIEIRTAPGASFAKLAMQARTNVYEFDIATINAPNVVQAMAANLLEPVDFNLFDRSAVPAELVFENAVGNHAYSTNICINTTKVPAGSMQSWPDFWNLQKYSGPRSLGRTLSQTIVFALLADGVPRDKLYPIDVDRVFRSLEKIKPQVRVWWTTGPQIRQLIGDGEVGAAGIWHAHGVALSRTGAPVEIVWKDFTLDRTYWIVSKGTPRASFAWQFINFALEPRNNAGFCIDGFYGPLNPRAFDFIEPAQAEDMPTNARYLPDAIEYDGHEMGRVLTPIQRRFDRWLQQ